MNIHHIFIIMISDTNIYSNEKWKIRCHINVYSSKDDFGKLNHFVFAYHLGMTTLEKPKRKKKVVKKKVKKTDSKK